MVSVLSFGLLHGGSSLEVADGEPCWKCQPLPDASENTGVCDAFICWLLADGEHCGNKLNNSSLIKKGVRF
jgi:hypothetical protein